MKIGFLLIGLLAVSRSFAQVVGGVDITSQDSIQVVEVFIERPAWRKSPIVSLDFGQADNSLYGSFGFNKEAVTIMDPLTRKKVDFRSTAAVLNYMHRYHWEPYDSATITLGSTSGFFYYFRRRNAEK